MRIIELDVPDAVVLLERFQDPAARVVLAAAMCSSHSDERVYGRYHIIREAADAGLGGEVLATWREELLRV